MAARPHGLPTRWRGLVGSWCGSKPCPSLTLLRDRRPSSMVEQPDLAARAPPAVDLVVEARIRGWFDQIWWRSHGAGLSPFLAVAAPMWRRTCVVVAGMWRWHGCCGSRPGGPRPRLDGPLGSLGFFLIHEIIYGRGRFTVSISVNTLTEAGGPTASVKALKFMGTLKICKITTKTDSFLHF